MLIRVLIADDHPVVRRGMVALLSSLDEIVVVGEVDNGEAAVREAQLCRPDVVVMDVQMPGIDGIEATRRIARAVPEIAVLVLTMFEDDETVLAAVQAGAQGYLLKGAGQADILAALRSVVAGQLVVGAEVAQRLVTRIGVGNARTPPFPELTGREREVLDLMAQGRNNTAIAEQLGLAVKTVGNHISSLFAKLHVASRSEAIVRAREGGLGGTPVTTVRTGRPEGVVRAAVVVGGGVAAADLWSLWASAVSDSVTSWGPAAIVVGAGCGLVGVLALLSRSRTRAPQLLLIAGASMLAAPLTALAAPRTAEALASAGAAILACSLPTIVAVHRARRAQRLLLLLLAASGVVAVAAVAVGRPAGAAVALLTGGLVLLAAAWVQYETTSGVQRRQVLWLVLGVCSSAGVSTLFMFTAAAVPAAPAAVSFVAALLCLPVPVAAGVALLCPDRWDVRSAISRVVLTAVMLLLSLSLFVGAVAALRAGLGRAPSTGLLAVVAALVGALHHPLLVQARRTIDELLFGGRADLVPTLARLGDQLNAAAAPEQWLESLRSALGVPGLVLQDGESILATAGALGAEHTSVPLRVGQTTTGELLVGLPEDRLRLPTATHDVLQLVAAPLAQALQSARLSEQLQHSRGQVVAVLEEERRRMRRDLHDGLGPTLTGVAYIADAAANLVGSSPEEASVLLHSLRSDVAAAIAEIRRIVYGLRPRALDELGLVGAVRQQTERLLARDGTPFGVDIEATDLPELPAAVEVVAYRVAVEAVTNVARHADVGRARVVFATDHQGALELVIQDGGSTAGPWKEGVGIASMRERVEQIGGTLFISGDRGGRVHARLPLHQVAPVRPGGLPGG